MRHVFKNIYCGSVVGNADVPSIGNFPFPEFNEGVNGLVRGIGFFTSNSLSIDANNQLPVDQSIPLYLTLVNQSGDIIFLNVNLCLFYIPRSQQAQSATGFRFNTRSNFFYFKKPQKISWRNSYIRGSLGDTVNIPFVIDYE